MYRRRKGFPDLPVSYLGKLPQLESGMHSSVLDLLVRIGAIQQNAPELHPSYGHDGYDPDFYWRSTSEPSLKSEHPGFFIKWLRANYGDSPDLEAWIKASIVVTDFWRHDRFVEDAYKRLRHRSKKRVVEICEASILLAPKHLRALQEIHEYRWKAEALNPEGFCQWIYDSYSIPIDPSTLSAPVIPPVQIPVHRGFRQLAILYDQQQKWDLAIDVCRRAIQVEWPGDWDVRISRYTSRIQKSKKLSSAKRATQARNIAAFCTQCGSALAAEDLYCGRCGSKRR